MFLKSISLFLVLGLIVLVSISARAATESTGLSTFDVYAAPYFAPSYGTYKAGSVDQGSSLALQFGARLGVKLGPILLGGEFGGAYLVNKSEQANMTTADEQKYVINGNGSLIQAGVHAGFKSENWAFIGTFYPISAFDAHSVVRATELSGKFDGIGYAIEVDRRLTKNLYLGLFGLMREFIKHTSGAISKADLDPKWQSTTYGLNLTYLISLSDFGALPSVFKSL